MRFYMKILFFHNKALPIPTEKVNKSFLNILYSILGYGYI